MTAAAVIPARFASSRLPGKPLLRETGKYLIQHVCEQVSKAKRLSSVIVATDDERIAEAVASFGGQARMTRPEHPSGTDRVAEVAASLDTEIILNIQGDEPEIEPAAIDQLVGLLEGPGAAPIATLACPFPADADPADPNTVKVVFDQRGRALYFSRAPIPYPRDTAGRISDPCAFRLHIGIYGYHRETLLQLAGLKPSPLEQVEKLEQLRFLENGFPIAVGLVDRAAVGIDTPDDYSAFVARVRAAQSR
jgi:3-deoxy-manno-octulosonate cytidylyltransferase (CMP-KDO synthetase)